MNKDLFQNKYRVKTIRLENWNYAWDGFYFFTICVKDKECCLGNVVDHKIYLSRIGKIVYEIWGSLSKHHKNIFLDEFIVMPNHVHGIIQIYNRNINQHGINTINRRDAINRVSTVNDKIGGITKKHNPMLNQRSLSYIIPWFKGRSKFEIRKISPEFKWQSRFYEHVIRHDLALDHIRQYIKDNPWNWFRDRNNPIN